MSKSGRPFVTYRKNGAAERVECDFIAGCDGSHGDQPHGDSCREADDFRAALSVRLARHLGRRAAGPARADLLQPRERVCAREHALAARGAGAICNATWTSGSRIGRTSGSGTNSCGGSGRMRARTSRAGPSFEKSIAPLAQLRRRADAAWAAVPAGRCGAYRAADRGQGDEPRGVRCGDAVGGAGSSSIAAEQMAG